MSLTVLDRKDAFRKALDAERAAGRRVGLVPTMGALHAGHLSLMARAAAECDVVAATLYVNPLQFGPSEDLAAYPRDAAGDAAKTDEAGVAFLFAPDQRRCSPTRRSPAWAWPASPKGSKVSTGPATSRAWPPSSPSCSPWPGRAGPTSGRRTSSSWPSSGGWSTTSRCRSRWSAARPSATPTVWPCRAATPTSPPRSGRSPRPSTGRCWPAARPSKRRHETDPDAVRRVMAEVIGAEPRFTLDYADVVASGDLIRLNPLAGEIRLLIAARLGRARLIDNLGARI